MTKQGIIVLILILVLVAGGAYAIFIAPQPSEEKVPDADTTEDTSGGRVAAGYVGGHVTIGPSCPGPEREDKPCITPPEAYTSREAVVYDSTGSEVESRVHLDAQGNYKIALGPGNYFVQIVPAGINPGEKKLVTIKSFETTTVNFDIDTGIR